MTHKSFLRCLLLLILVLPAVASIVSAKQGQNDEPNRQPLSALGEQLYFKCIACHSPGYHRTGPLHCGVVGRKAGSAPGYEYSDAMKHAGFVWTAEQLDTFLTDPLKTVPGTSMGFAGIADPQQRLQIIRYLENLTAQHAACR